jgi:DNA-binding Lrp family transcriptional regulator
MEKLDLKYRKILYHLEYDARQSFRTIAKKVELTKDVVITRVNKLKESGIIFNFYTVIDINKLGYNIYRFYLKYQYITPEIEKEIIDYFVKSKLSIAIAKVEGSWDLIVLFSVKNLSEMYDFWEKTLAKYRDYFAAQAFAVYFKEHLYNYSFLIDENISERSDTSKVEIFGGRKKVEIDNLDLQILKLIVTNARMSTIEVAKALNSTVSVIHYRIKKLIESDIIQGYRTSIDLSRFGYKLFKVDILLKDAKYKNQIIKYIEKIPYLRGRDATLGYTDLEFTFYLKNINQLQQIMGDIATKFPNVIRNYQYSSDIKVYKYCYMPEE